MRRTFFSLLVLAWSVSSVNVSRAQSGALASSDLSAIRTAVDAYRTSWLTNRRNAVMETLTADAVLLPAHAQTPIAGRAAIERFWWPPDSPVTVVVAFDSTIDEVSGTGDMAFARGTFVLRFRLASDAEGQIRTNEGAYLMLLRRQAGNSWRISHRMWDDRVSR